VRFEKTYRSRGEWAQFFCKDESYLGTELLHDPDQANRYITLDFWRSRSAYQHFKTKQRDTYQMIDERCESLTTHEAEIGQFSRESSKNRRS
jgi:heme-degrading monooxygenase HmoA